MKTSIRVGYASSFSVSIRHAALLAAALSFALCGCTPPRQWIANRFKVGPNYARPAATSAPQWIDSADPRVKTEQLSNVRWWHVFGDEKLNELVQSAYQQNLSLKEACCRVIESRLQLAIARGNFFPQQQQMFADYSRSMSSLSAASGPWLPNRYMSIWDGGFNLSWELDLWGKYRRAIESADAQYEASIEDYDAVLVSLVGDVAQTYAQIRTLERQLELLRQNVDLQRKTLDLAKIRFDGGATGKLDVVQAEANLAQTESLIPPQEILLRQARNRICFLLSIPPENLDARIGSGPIPNAPTSAAVGIPGDLMRRRPDVRAAERRLAAQSAQIGVNTAQLYPQIAITGTIGLEASRLADLGRSQSAFGSIGPSLRWDILNYGRNLNRIRIADTQFRELALGYQNRVLQANEEVEDGLATFLGSQELVKSLKRSVDAAQESVDLVLYQYREGKVDFNRVFTVQRELVQQENQYAQAQGGVVQGLIQVYRALGGGWEFRCEGDSSVNGAIPAADADTAKRPPDDAEPEAPQPPSAPTKPASPAAKPKLPKDDLLTPEKLPASSDVLEPENPKATPEPFMPRALPEDARPLAPDELDPTRIPPDPVLPKRLTPDALDSTAPRLDGLDGLDPAAEPERTPDG